MADLQWHITVAQMNKLHDTATERFMGEEMTFPTEERRLAAQSFLDKVHQLRKYDAYSLSHKQLRFLCRLAGADASEYIVATVPYVWATS